MFLLLLVGCSISEKEEIEMGRQSHAQFEKEFGGLYPDQHVQQYVNGVGSTMARYAGRPNLQWQFAVVSSDQINAFAVPGGYIYITQGLLFRMSNEAQLAGVLGHESGHIAHRHSVKQIQKARGAQGLTVVAGLAGTIFGIGGVGDITGLVAGLTLMKYGRDQEREADFSGLKYMTDAGYSPAGMVQLIEVLKSSSGKGSPEFLSTHPDPGNRIDYLTQTIQQKYAPAAQTGELGEANFKLHVLSRRPGGLAKRAIEVDRPESWCALCRREP
ncbi:MAG: M48 family metallopeptidase [Tepidisphaeraceae bacterium]